MVALVALFVFSNAVGLSLVLDGRLSASHFVGPLVWLLVQAASLALLLRYRPTFDPVIFAVLLLFSGWSILLADRLAPVFLSRQVSWVVLGTAVVLLTTLIPNSLSWLRRYRYSLLLIGVLLLVATFFFGVNPSGASSANYWLKLPLPVPVFFQPSELLKLLLVIFLASYFDEQAFISNKRNVASLLGPIAIMGGFCVLLLVWQQDLGAATLFFLLFLSLFYVATGRKTYLIAGLGLLLVAGTAAYFLFDVVALRVDAWLNPWPNADGRAFQIVQSLYALAAGGVFGQGIGQGYPEYIPVVHSDFVFAAIGEEWGLIGSLTVLLGFALLMHRGMMIGLRAKRPFHRFLAAGITILISAQAILIMGGVIKLLPLTGVTLPFISYGGSSMVISHLMAGLLLYLSCQPQQQITPTRGLSPSQRYLQHLHFAFLFAFMAIGVMLIFWPIVRAGAILLRDDNPRQVEAELRIRRGQILDRDGVIVAQTVGNGNLLSRIYPFPAIGPAVGYYSFRHGTAGVEDGYDDLLRGERSFFEQGILHRPPQGSDLQLTISAPVQTVATELMAGHTGGLILFRMEEATAVSAEIIAMVSSPTYDPNELDASFDTLIDNEAAPLLNRATLGQYQPGMILQPFVMATAVDQQQIFLNQEVEAPHLPVVLNGEVYICHEGQNGVSSWTGVLQRRCPNPMLMLGEQLGQGGLSQSFNGFGLTQPITLPLDVAETAVQPINSPNLAAIGQDSLTVSPLSLGRAWMALLTNGRLPSLQLVIQQITPEGIIIPEPPPDVNTQHAISANSARIIQGALPQSEGGFVEFSGTARSGPDTNRNSWYLGQRTVEEALYFVVLVLEESDDFMAAEQIGRAVLEQVGRLETK